MILPILSFMLTLEPPVSNECRGPLTREVVIHCAAASSPRLLADQQSIAAARGGAAAARVVLPSNPTAAVTVGRRWNTAQDRAVNVTGSISQPIEIGGQRRRRRDAAQAEIHARQNHATVTQRDVVAQALLAYYDVLAARQEVHIVERASATAQRLGEVAQSRAAAGLGIPLDTDLAAAEAAAVREQVALRQGQRLIAEARLASALGMDPTAPLPEIRGTLSPLETPADLDRATSHANTRPELAQLQAQRNATTARLHLRKAERAPSPSLSIFAQTDGFNERVIGGGLSFPIPLPFPLGRTNKGQIEAARAQIRETDHRITAVARQVTLEATVAYLELESRRQAASAYSAESLAQAEQGLTALAGEIDRGRIPVRDALITQQALMTLLLRAIESNHELCNASVGLVLASGAPFEGSAP